MAPIDFEAAFSALTSGDGPPRSPFPWQGRLHAMLAAGYIPQALDLPTGLGKTSAMAVWLLARAGNPSLPRRLVYVVDRRAIVDQATREAEGLAEALGFGTGPCRQGLEPVRAALDNLGAFSISTLRGRHADNRAWTQDPAGTAIVVGTVDMIGSRLLFSGYGIGKNSRAMHAGLLGHDTLLVLDEAHLVPPFAELALAVAGQADLGGREPVPASRLRVMALSATLGVAGGKTFGLDDADRADATVAERIHAAKVLERRGAEVDGKTGLPKPEAFVEAVQELAGSPPEADAEPRRIAVFCHRRETAEKVAGALRSGKATAILLTGARRVKERKDAEAELAAAGFLPGGSPTGPAILVATSAAEVGVDLDATDAVMDLVAWERMVQRLGRVNRRGKRPARVIVLDGGTETSPERAELAAVRGLMEALGEDASPNATGAVTRANAGMVERASTPRPLRPALTRPVLESWSMTGIEDHPGRPDIEPWLRGWVKDQQPQTRVIWRAQMPVRMDGDHDTATEAEVTRFLAAAPPHLAEEIEAEVSFVLEMLKKRLSEKTLPEGMTDARTVAFLLDRRGALIDRWSLEGLARAVAATGAQKDTRAADRLAGALPRGTLVLDARLGGLDKGSLAKESKGPVDTADGDPGWPDLTGWTVAEESEPQRDGEPEIDRFVLRRSAEGVAVKWLVVRRVAGRLAEETGAAWSRGRRWVTLVDHTVDVEAKARAFGDRLDPQGRLGTLLACAARLHDIGKLEPRWQAALAGKRPGGPFAKSARSGRLDAGAYRHETGSLLFALGDWSPEGATALVPDVCGLLADLSDEDRDLVLHLVASHHGRGRPGIGIEDFQARSPGRLAALGLEAALRFARLERRFGPWGLAWWEAVFRAADQAASRDEEKDV